MLPTPFLKILQWFIRTLEQSHASCLFSDCHLPPHPHPLHKPNGWHSHAFTSLPCSCSIFLLSCQAENYHTSLGLLVPIKLCPPDCIVPLAILSLCKIWCWGRILFIPILNVVPPHLGLDKSMWNAWRNEWIHYMETYPWEHFHWGFLHVSAWLSQNMLLEK